MNIVALYKTWHSFEFVEASIESIYPFMHAIVFVHSDVSWTGERGNDVAPVVEAWKKKYDKENKITNLYFDTVSQEEQYRYGMNYIDQNYRHQAKMYCDSDEVWKYTDIKNAIEFVANDKTHDVFTCSMWSFLRSPFYRISNPDCCHPVVFVRSGVPYTGLRCTGVSNKIEMLGIFLHHFTGVRRSLKYVLEKYRVSSACEREALVDQRLWVETKWNNLPHVTNFQPNTRYTNTWKGIQEVALNDLPETCRNKPFVLAFQNYVHVPRIHNIKKADMNGLPEGFGPDHPDWNVPSKRNKYLALLQTQAGMRGEVVVQKPTPPVVPVPVAEVVRPIAPSKRNRMLAEITNEGRMCMTTIVSGDYQWYIPLWTYCAHKAYPDHDVKVFVRGKCVLPEKYMKDVVKIRIAPKHEDGYTTAALRFVWGDDYLSGYEYCLISDIDLLHRKEVPPLVDQRMMDLRAYDLECYSNYVSSIHEGDPRMPGVHFVTKDWWKRTAAVRKKYLTQLVNGGSPSWEFDETMIYKICKESGLNIQDKEQKLWCMHGLHLGDVRRRIRQGTKNSVPLTAHDQLFVVELLNDPEFKNLIEDCGQHIDTLKQTFQIYRGLV